MVSQTIFESAAQGVHLPIDPPSARSRSDRFELLLEELVATFEQQRLLREIGGHWDDRAALQTALHELRAALAIERDRARSG